jgi:N-acetylglutamate synthase-like GNAT family acetyltransferase
MYLKFAPFTVEDFPEYQSWFQDKELNQALGPMKKNDEWLLTVLKRDKKMVCEYSIFNESKELIAVVGILLPRENNTSFYITDFAIKPNVRGRGIGKEILRKLFSLHSKKEEKRTWKTFVHETNTKAKHFFKTNGWAIMSKDTNGNGMLLFQKELDA